MSFIKELDFFKRPRLMSDGIIDENNSTMDTDSNKSNLRKISLDTPFNNYNNNNNNNNNINNNFLNNNYFTNKARTSSVVSLYSKKDEV